MTPLAVTVQVQLGTVPVPSREYYLAWADTEGGGIDEEYRTLGEAVERGEIAQRWIDAGGNWQGRRYEVRERVYGRVVWRALTTNGGYR